MPGLTWDITDNRATAPIGAPTVQRWTSRQVCAYLDNEIRPELQGWSARDLCDRLRSAVIGVRESDVATLAGRLGLSIVLSPVPAVAAHPLPRPHNHTIDDIACQEANRPCTY